MFLDLEQVNWIPINDATNQIVHTGTAVHSVIIGGRMVVENRRLLTVDVPALACRAERSRERLQNANKPSKALYDRAVEIVGTFCPGLAKQPLHIDRFGGGTIITVTTPSTATPTDGTKRNTGLPPAARQQRTMLRLTLNR